MTSRQLQTYRDIERQADAKTNPSVKSAEQDFQTVFKNEYTEFFMDTVAGAPSFRLLVIARVAELADAVDSKSTDESLVGSTPTPGKLLIGKRRVGRA